MLRRILLSGVGLVLLGLARFAFNWVAINVFGEDTAGRLNVALSLAFLAALPATTAFAPAVLRFVAQARGRGDDRAASALARILLAGTVATTVIVSTAGVALEAWIGEAKDIPPEMARLALLVSAAYVFYLFFRSVLYAVDRVLAYTGLELAASVVFFTSLGALAVSGAGNLLLLPFVLGYATFAAGAFFIERARFARSAGPRIALRPVASFSLLALAGTASSLSIREIGTLLAPDYSDLAGTAFFAASVAFLSPMQFVPRTLQSVLFARSAEQEGRGDAGAIAEDFTEVNHWLVLATLPITALMIILAAPILSLIGSAPSAERIQVFRLLCVATAAEVIATPAVNALAGVGRIVVNTWSAVLGLAVAAGVWLGLGPASGLEGLALGYLASSLIRASLPAIEARRRLAIRLSARPAVLLSVTVASLLALAIAEETGRAVEVALAYAAIVAVVSRRELVTLFGRLRRA